MKAKDVLNELQYLNNNEIEDALARLQRIKADRSLSRCNRECSDLNELLAKMKTIMRKLKEEELLSEECNFLLHNTFIVRNYGDYRLVDLQDW